jgi:hypothetical protein
VGQRFMPGQNQRSTIDALEPRRLLVTVVGPAPSPMVDEPMVGPGFVAAQFTGRTLLRSGSTSPGEEYDALGQRYYATQHELWRSDGSRAGTFALHPDLPIHEQARSATLDGRLYFASVFSDVWQTAGTPRTTRRALAGADLFYSVADIVAHDGAIHILASPRSADEGSRAAVWRLEPRGRVTRVTGRLFSDRLSEDELAGPSKLFSANGDLYFTTTFAPLDSSLPGRFDVYRVDASAEAGAVLIRSMPFLQNDSFRESAVRIPAPTILGGADGKVYLQGTIGAYNDGTNIDVFDRTGAGFRLANGAAKLLHRMDDGTIVMLGGSTRRNESLDRPLKLRFVRGTSITSVTLGNFTATPGDSIASGDGWAFVTLDAGRTLVASGGTAGETRVVNPSNWPELIYTSQPERVPIQSIQVVAGELRVRITNARDVVALRTVGSEDQFVALNREVFPLSRRPIRGDAAGWNLSFKSLNDGGLILDDGTNRRLLSPAMLPDPSRTNVRVRLFIDANRNGIWDRGESPAAGYRAALDASGLTPGAVTDVDGNVIVGSAGRIGKLDSTDRRFRAGSDGMIEIVGLRNGNQRVFAMASIIGDTFTTPTSILISRASAGVFTEVMVGVVPGAT